MKMLLLKFPVHSMLIYRFSGVMVLPAISKCDLHAAIRDSFALVNTSLSEGMSSAILEVREAGLVWWWQFHKR